MKYRYRYFYALCLIIIATIIFYFNDIKPLLLHKHNLLVDQTSFQTRLSVVRLKNKFSQKNKFVLTKTTKELFLNDTILQAHLHNLNLINIGKMSQESINNNVLFHLSLKISGAYQNIDAYLQTLSQFASPIYFTDFAYHLMNDQSISVTLHLLRFEKNIVSDAIHPIIKTHFNPLCHPTAITNSNSLNVLNDVPLSAIKMVGYMQQKNHLEALLLTPGGHVASVGIGMLLGKEGTRVLSIEKNRLVLLLQKDQLHSIYF